MGVVNTTYTFQATDTITSAKMNNIIDQTTITGSAIDGTTLEVTGSGKLKIRSQGITSNELALESVKFEKLANSLIATTLDAVSSTTLATSQSIKDYVDTQIIYKPSITGTATFTKTTNNIFLTGVGLLSELTVGDVIEITGSTSNNKIFTVDVITDENNIIVNQAHANGTTSKALILENATANVTVTVLARWYNAPIGFGQDWVDVISNRATSTTYTNSTNRAITLALRGQQFNIYGQLYFYVNSLPISTDVHNASSFYVSVGGIIPKGAIYENQAAGVNVINWYELR